MVLYKFELLNLDDYNLTYSQNKNRVFENNLTATPLKPYHFLYTKISQNQFKPIKTTKHDFGQPPKLVYNQYKHFHPKVFRFSSTQHKKRKARVWFPYFYCFHSSIPSIILPLDLSNSWLLGEKSQSPFSTSPSSLFLSQNGNAYM